MSRREILVDTDLCYGCFACEVACKQEHSLPVGTKRINVIQVGPMMVGGKLEMAFVPMKCSHCTKAPCIDACPEGVITRRSDGMVLINTELCFGCMACLEACPFGVIQMNPVNGLADKCDLCVDRVDAGLQPACVQYCPTGALQFGAPNELMARKQKVVAQEKLGIKA